VGSIGPGQYGMRCRSWQVADQIEPRIGKIKRAVRAGSRGQDVTCSTPFGSRNETNWGPPRVPFPRCLTSLLYSLTKHVEEGAWKAGKCSRCGRSSCQTTQGGPPRGEETRRGPGPGCDQRSKREARTRRARESGTGKGARFEVVAGCEGRGRQGVRD
jgi:hypothetical protein